MNDFFVNLHGWLKEQWALIGTIVILGILTLVMHSYGTPVTYLGIAILLAAAPFLSYAGWARLKQQQVIEDEIRQLQGQVDDQKNRIDELLVKRQADAIRLNTQQNEIEAAKREIADKDGALADVKETLALRENELGTARAQSERLHDSAAFKGREIDSLRGELRELYGQFRGALTVLASAYPAGIRAENYLDAMRSFLYIDLPGDQVRFHVYELDGPADQLHGDAKTFAKFLSTLPPYEKAWDAHLPTMVFDRLSALGDKLHDLRTSPPVTVATTGKAPTKARAIKKRARGPKA